MVRPRGKRPTCIAAIVYQNYTARRVNASGCADGFKLGSNVTLEDSYLHDLFHWGGPYDGTHNDAMQVNQNATANSVVIRGNAFHLKPCIGNRHLQIGGATVGELLIEHNFFFGSHGVLNVGEGTVQNGRFINNVLAGSTLRGPFSNDGGSKKGPGLYTGDGMSAFTRTGNVFESGESVDTDTRAAGEYECEP